MIKSFRDRDIERLFERAPTKRFKGKLQEAVLRKLLMLEAAISLDDLRALPGNRLEKLKGDRAGQYSIRVNDQWRVCFEWSDGDAFEVEVVDYH